MEIEAFSERLGKIFLTAMRLEARRKVPRVAHFFHMHGRARAT